MESETVLQIRRSFSAPPEKVFQAWTKKERFSAWFAPSQEYKTIILDFDVRPGGKYRVELRSPDGKSHIVHGVYSEVVPPKRLVFTWTWESEPQHGETEVILEFFPAQKGTEMILTHRNFPTGSSREEHNKGWNACLDRLQKLTEAA